MKALNPLTRSMRCRGLALALALGLGLGLASVAQADIHVDSQAAAVEPMTSVVTDPHPLDVAQQLVGDRARGVRNLIDRHVSAP